MLAVLLRQNRPTYAHQLYQHVRLVMNPFITNMTNRLLNHKMIELCDGPQVQRHPDAVKRKWFRLTAAGRTEAQASVEYLEQVQALLTSIVGCHCNCDDYR